MHAKGKRVRVEMGTGAGIFGDNTKPFFGYIKSSSAEDGGSCNIFREGVIPKRAQNVPAKHAWLDTSSSVEIFHPQSRGRASDADKKRIAKKLDMDQEVTLRGKDKEIANLKEARNRVGRARDSGGPLTQTTPAAD
jgi:hypothetical protein